MTMLYYNFEIISIIIKCLRNYLLINHLSKFTNKGNKYLENKLKY